MPDIFLFVVYLGASACREGGRPTCSVRAIDSRLQTGALHSHTGPLSVELPNDIWEHGHCGEQKWITITISLNFILCNMAPRMTQKEVNLATILHLPKNPPWKIIYHIYSIACFRKRSRSHVLMFNHFVLHPIKLK